MHYIVYNSLQPVVYSVAQNVSKIQIMCSVLQNITRTNCCWQCCVQRAYNVKKIAKVLWTMLETVFDKLLFTLSYKKRVQRCLMYHSFLCLGLLSKWTVWLQFTICPLNYYTVICSHEYTPAFTHNGKLSKKYILTLPKNCKDEISGSAELRFHWIIYR